MFFPCTPAVFTSLGVVSANRRSSLPCADVVCSSERFLSAQDLVVAYQTFPVSQYLALVPREDKFGDFKFFFRGAMLSLLFLIFYAQNTILDIYT